METTTPESAPLPELRGGAATEPESIDAPRPRPLVLRPAAVRPSFLLREGGGGTTLGEVAEPTDAAGLTRLPGVAEKDGGGGTTASVAAGGAGEERPLRAFVDGGGGTTLAVKEGRVADEVRAAVPEMAGGGGTTSALSELAVRDEAPAATVGGGATTVLLPNTRSIRLLINDVFAGVGGGGTTLLERSGRLPLARR